MKLFRIVTFCLMVITLPSCVDNVIEMQLGEQLDEEVVNSTATLHLRASETTGDRTDVLLNKGDSFCTEEFYVHASKPITSNQTLLLETRIDLVSAYSLSTGIEYKELPASFYEFIGGGSFEFTQGSRRSEMKQVKIYGVNKLGNVLESGRYLLPITLVSPWQDSENSTIYIDVTVRNSWETKAELHDGSELYMVFYLNTAQFDPRLATDFYIEKIDDMWNRVWYQGVGNIVNLRKSSVGYDYSTGQATLELTSDMKYILENYDTYIRPVQETGRKVCLCIEGGGKGIGFCNMSDNQIDDFVYQVKTIVERFHLDGVNLWDRDAKYGKDDTFPRVNTTSYPKLIMSLRQALGNYKLLTLVDYEEPTEYFWDIEACGGIEVGGFIDYAWSGYNQPTDKPYEIEVIDPYHQDMPGVSVRYPRKPIAGLNPKRYGCTNAYWHQGQSEYTNLINWENAGLRQNCIFVFEDIRSNLQDAYEGGTWNPEPFLWAISTNKPYKFIIDNMQLSDRTGSGYNKWIKTW